MHCSNFLNRYSDLRDGQITDLVTLREMQEHLRTCPRCRRYEQAIQHGIGALRTLGQIEPSPKFQRELRVRLAKAALGARGQPRLTPAALTAAVLVAVAGALLLYEGFMGRRPAEVAGTARPIPVVVVNPGVPFVSFTSSDLAAPPAMVVPTSLSRPAAEWGTIAP
jgi:anti-sigma factor RsiW